MIQILVISASFTGCNAILTRPVVPDLKNGAMEMY